MFVVGQANKSQLVLDDEEQQYEGVVQKVRKKRPDVHGCKQREADRLERHQREENSPRYCHAACVPADHGVQRSAPQGSNPGNQRRSTGQKRFAEQNHEPEIDEHGRQIHEVHCLTPPPKDYPGRNKSSEEQRRRHAGASNRQAQPDNSYCKPHTGDDQGAVEGKGKVNEGGIPGQSRQQQIGLEPGAPTI